MSKSKRRSYSHRLAPGRQAIAEDRIQALIVNNTTASEDVAAKIARRALYLTLREFRRDLFEPPPARPSQEG